MTENKNQKGFLRGLFCAFRKKSEPTPQPQEPEQQMTLSDLIDACIELVRDNEKVHVIEGGYGNRVMRDYTEIFEFHHYSRRECGIVYHLSLKGNFSVYDIKKVRDGIYAAIGQEVAEVKLEELEDACEKNKEEYAKVLKVDREIERQKTLNREVKFVRGFLGK